MRIITILLLVALPWAAHADAATSDAGSTATAQTDSGSPLQNTGAAAISGQTSSVLQPANAGTSASLQQADASGGGVVQSGGAQNLQQSGTASDAKLLIGGDTDGPQQPSQGIVVTGLGYLLIALLATTALTAVVWLIQRRQVRPAA